MTDVPVSYSHADTRGVAAFEQLDNLTTQNLLAGSEPELLTPNRFLMESNMTFPQFAVVGFNSNKKLAWATSGLASAALLTLGAGNAAVTVTAIATGIKGNTITLAILAASGAGAVAVSGTAITVTPASAANTANAVVAQINANPQAAMLVLASAGGTGASATAAASGTLAGGVEDVDAIGVVVHASASGSSNTTKHALTWRTGCFNVGDDSPLVFDASFNTLAKKTILSNRSSQLVFRSRRATGTPGI